MLGVRSPAVDPDGDELTRPAALHDNALGGKGRMHERLFRRLPVVGEQLSRGEVDVLIVDEDGNAVGSDGWLPKKNPANPGGRRGAMTATIARLMQGGDDD